MEEANRPLPVPKDGFTFESLIRNRTEVEHFKEFLNKKHGKGNDHSFLPCSLPFYNRHCYKSHYCSKRFPV